MIDPLSEKAKALHRYTITGEGASPGYFRLVEDSQGAWMQSAEVLAALRDVQRETREEQMSTVKREGMPDATWPIDWLLCTLSSMGTSVKVGAGDTARACRELGMNPERLKFGEPDFQRGVGERIDAATDILRTKINALERITAEWIDAAERQSQLRKQDAAWMQHKPDCGMQCAQCHNTFGWIAHSQPLSEGGHMFQKSDCSCGLSARLQEIQT